jgi:hypothetical protein
LISILDNRANLKEETKMIRVRTMVYLMIVPVVVALIYGIIGLLIGY